MKATPRSGWRRTRARSAASPGSAVLAALTGRSVAETGTTTFRPPFAPIPIAALGPAPRARAGAAALSAGACGDGGDGGARSSRPGSGSARAGSRAAGETTGGGLRPRGRRWCGGAVGRLRRHDARQDRRAGAGRGALLDRVYANTMSTLAIGRVRYGADAARGRLRHGRRHGGAARGGAFPASRRRRRRRRRCWRISSSARSASGRSSTPQAVPVTEHGRRWRSPGRARASS